MNTEANIEIIRANGVLNSVSIVMPTWNKIGEDGFLAVNIPLFGIKTFAKNEDDAITAIEEAVKCFCITAEKFGQGLENELITLGWHRNNLQQSFFDYLINEDDFVLEQIMQTADQYAEQHLQIA